MSVVVDIIAETGLTPEQVAAAKALDALTDEQRSEVFYFYCFGCGRKQYRDPSDRHGCACTNDE